jgi:hypothetical protein
VGEKKAEGEGRTSNVEKLSPPVRRVLLLVLRHGFEVKAMEEPVVDRSENDTDAGDEGQPAEQSVAPGEKFAGVGLKGSQRAHSRKDHGSVRE